MLVNKVKIIKLPFYGYLKINLIADGSSSPAIIKGSKVVTCDYLSNNALITYMVMGSLFVLTVVGLSI